MLPKLPIYARWPCSFTLQNIINVAATDNDDNLADFSHYGATSVDLAGPGVRIFSTELDTSYRFGSGTSFAGPHVAGVAALVMTRMPDLTWQQVRQRILNTVRTPIPVPNPLEGKTVTGGIVNAYSALLDCNSNGIDDQQDIAAGTSTDCNTNNFPDECELSADCNNNGVQDICDVAAGTSQDCNTNDIPDECEVTSDCNANGQADICDIASGFSTDCNRNGIPDECEPQLDANGNGVPDVCEFECTSGGCCWPDGSCTGPVSGLLCLSSGGVFQGPNTACGTVGTVACCMSDGTCTTQIHSSCCEPLGGTPAAANDCSLLGACCPPGTETQCIDTLESCCETIGGTFNSTQVCDPPGGPLLLCNPGTQSVP